MSMARIQDQEAARIGVPARIRTRRLPLLFAALTDRSGHGQVRAGEGTVAERPG